MAYSEQLIRRVSGAFVALLRESSLRSSVSAPEVLFFVSKQFGKMYADGVLKLDLLYAELSAIPGIDKSALQGLFIAFHDQYDRLGVELQLPAPLLRMPLSQRDKLLDAMRQPAAVPAVKRAPQPARKDPFKASKTGSADLPTTRWPRRVGLIVVVVVALALLVSIVMTPVPPVDTVPVVALDLAEFGLSGELVRKESYFGLKVERAQWVALTEIAREEGLEALWLACEEMGVHMLVVDDESFTTMAVVTEKGVVHYDVD